MIDKKRYEEALYNILLFLPGKGDEKSQASLGWARFVYHDRWVEIQGADNYVFVSSEVVTDENERPTEWWHRDELKAELAAVRDLTDEVIHRQSLDTSRLTTYGGPNQEPPHEMVSQLYDGYDLLWGRDHREVSLNSFLLNPNRVSKFSLLKPQDEYPVDFKGASMTLGDQYKSYLRWRMGPRTRGILGILDRQEIEKVIKEKEALW